MNPLLELSAPLRIQISSKKNFILNLNNFQNTHRFTRGKAKNNYTEAIFRLLQYKKPVTIFPVSVVYTYYAESRRKIDVANPCSIIDKYTQDAIVKAGYLPDDNHKYVDNVLFRWGGVDKENPRAEMRVYDSKEFNLLLAKLL